MAKKEDVANVEKVTETENVNAEKVTETEGANAEKTSAKTSGPDMVEIFLFKDGDKYKDDVFVAVNGKTYQIQRGVPVKVPRFVKEVLDNSMKQDMAAVRYMEKEQEKFEKEAKKLDI